MLNTANQIIGFFLIHIKVNKIHWGLLCVLTHNICNPRLVAHIIALRKASSEGGLRETVFL